MENIRQLYEKMLRSKGISTWIKIEENLSVVGYFLVMTIFVFLTIGIIAGGTLYYQLSPGISFRGILSFLFGTITTSSFFGLVHLFDIFRLEQKVSKFSLLNNDSMADLLQWFEKQHSQRKDEVVTKVSRTKKLIGEGVVLAKEMIKRSEQEPNNKLAALYAKQAKSGLECLEEMLSELTLGEQVWQNQLEISFNQLSALKVVYAQALEAGKMRQLTKIENDAKRETALVLDIIGKYLETEGVTQEAYNNLLTNAESFRMACEEINHDPRVDVNLPQATV